MRTWMSFAVGIGLAAAADAGHAQQRQAGAHEHGRGTLNIAVEGSRLSVELEAPGADIVGFEHKAKTQKQKAAVAAAKKQLAAPQELFELPVAAGCALKEAKVAFEAEDDHGHDHGAKHHAGKGHGPTDGAKGGGKGSTKEGHADDEHSVFTAEYTFDCKAPANLTTIGFGYFKAFAGAQKLDVTVIGPKQQNSFQVNRANPRIDLGGMM
jgi:uncharacterized protein DUF2796